MKSFIKTISLVLAAAVLMLGVLTVGAKSVKADDMAPIGGDALIDDAQADLEDQVDQQEHEGITYTTPAEAFQQLADKVVGIFKFIGGLFESIKEKFGTGAYIGAIAGVILIYVFFIFCLAIAFKKAGVNPIWAVIPVVSVYYCFKIGWETEKLWKLLIALVVAILFSTLGKIREINGWEVPSILTTLITLVSIIGWGLVIVFTIHLSQGWAEGYKLHFAFGIGLLILPFVFVPILALVKNVKYQYALGTGQVKVN